jgi:hypothetical protein
MHASSLRRLQGDANAFLRASLGLSLFVALLWGYAWLQLHG